MNKVYIALMVGAALAMSGCCCNSGKTTTSDDSAPCKTCTKSTTVKTGTFEGTMPAADCEGIRTTLKVNDDSTYFLRREYIGEENGLFEANGVYNIADKGLLELITPSSGEKVYFVEVENGYMLSDSLGTINQGELAQMYILKPAK